MKFSFAAMIQTTVFGLHVKANSGEKKRRVARCICSRSLSSFFNLHATISIVLGPSLFSKVRSPVTDPVGQDLSFKMPPIPVEVRRKGKPWPGYFLVRNTGEVVPLIAVDELPPSIELLGVPRSLDLEETIGMLNLGLQRSTGGFYKIVQGHESKSQSMETVGKAK